MPNCSGLSAANRFLKRSFDVAGASLGLACTFWLIGLAFLAASIDTRRNGMFTQLRVGRAGRMFKIMKIRTMRDLPTVSTTVTTAADPRITRLGRLLRRTKVDELPQLVNVLLGQMSFVGPRPDVPGFLDALQGRERLILTLRPGLTGPATLKYRNEEAILSAVADPETYNREVIYPDKVSINLAYLEQYRFSRDLGYLWRTVAGK